MPFWENEYKNNKTFVFGKPSKEVVDSVPYLKKGARILDVGCGDGRHAIYLAKLGFKVDAFDLSKNAIEKIDYLKQKLIDERNEIGGCLNGIPTFDLGKRTDIISNSSKAKGIIMAIRAMGPKILAVDEIAKLIQKISGSANTYRFIVTADHGFIYKRDKVTASDKIGGMSDASRLVKRRYIVSKEPINEQGVCNIGLGYMLGSDDDKIISYSCSIAIISTINCVFCFLLNIWILCY